MVVTSPSILSKLDQKLRYGFAPNIVERIETRRSVKEKIMMNDLLGRYPLAKSMRISQRPKINSVMVLKKKFFPEINGKKWSRGTMIGVSKIKKRPTRIAYFRIFSLTAIDMFQSIIS